MSNSVACDTAGSVLAWVGAALSVSPRTEYGPVLARSGARSTGPRPETPGGTGGRAPGEGINARVLFDNRSIVLLKSYRSVPPQSRGMDRLLMKWILFVRSLVFLSAA
jgi:hypothetical protein